MQVRVCSVEILWVRSSESVGMSGGELVGLRVGVGESAGVQVHGGK